MDHSTIKETQDHIKRLDAEIVKYGEYVALLEGTKRLLQRSIAFLQTPASEETMVNYVGFKSGEEPLGDLQYKRYIPTDINVDCFQFHRKEGFLVYGLYDGSPVFVDTTVQIFCHFANFSCDPRMPQRGSWHNTWTDSKHLKNYLLSEDVQQIYPITGRATPLTANSIVNVFISWSGGDIRYQTYGYEHLYHGTALVTNPYEPGFCTRDYLLKHTGN